MVHTRGVQNFLDPPSQSYSEQLGSATVRLGTTPCPDPHAVRGFRCQTPKAGGELCCFPSLRLSWQTEGKKAGGGHRGLVAAFLTFRCLLYWCHSPGALRALQSTESGESSVVVFDPQSQGMAEENPFRERCRAETKP